MNLGRVKVLFDDVMILFHEAIILIIQYMGGIDNEFFIINRYANMY